MSCSPSTSSPPVPAACHGGVWCSSTGSKNALFPVLTILGVRVSQLIGGTVVIETVFNIQGMGRTLVNAAINADMDVVLGVTVVAALAVILTESGHRRCPATAQPPAADGMTT